MEGGGGGNSESFIWEGDFLKLSIVVSNSVP